MTIYDVKRLAMVLAVQAEIEGMKVANWEREINGHEAPAFPETAFFYASEQLMELASKHDEQL